MMFQFFLIYMILMNSVMFYFSKTPLSMGMNILLQTMMISIMSGIVSLNFWYSYILFLVMIGAMLILFIYVSSLSSNQKFNFNKKKLFLMLLISLMIFFWFKNLNLMNLNSDSISLMNMNFNEMISLKMSMNKLYNLPTNYVMIIVMNYLLFTLFVVVELININLGPLRKNF